MMSNHYHLVVHMSPAAANNWNREEVARRWVKLYPTSKQEADQLKIWRTYSKPSRNTGSTGGTGGTAPTSSAPMSH